MQTPESNKEMWWEDYEHICNDICIENNHELARFHHFDTNDLRSLLANQHKLSVEACMEVVKYNIRKYDGPDLEDRIISALSEMKEKEINDFEK